MSNYQRVSRYVLCSSAAVSLDFPRMPGHSSGEEEIPQEEQQGALVGTELEGVYDTEIMIEVIYVYIIYNII